VEQPIELIPLLCLRCSAPIPAQPGEVAWVCQTCGQGSLLDEQGGLVPLEVNYSAAVPTQAWGKPYWVSSGRVALRRETYKGYQRSESEKFWAQPRLFCIPAFNCSLDVLLPVGRMWLNTPPALQPGSPVPFEPVVLALVDVRSAAEFIVMSVEAGRKDSLRVVDFILELDPAVLWILPP
jgi:hypothetical protein